MTRLSDLAIDIVVEVEQNVEAHLFTDLRDVEDQAAFITNYISSTFPEEFLEQALDSSEIQDAFDTATSILNEYRRQVIDRIGDPDDELFKEFRRAVL